MRRQKNNTELNAPQININVGKLTGGPNHLSPPPRAGGMKKKQKSDRTPLNIKKCTSGAEDDLSAINESNYEQESIVRDRKQFTNLNSRKDNAAP